MNGVMWQPSWLGDKTLQSFFRLTLGHKWTRLKSQMLLFWHLPSWLEKKLKFVEEEERRVRTSLVVPNRRMQRLPGRESATTAHFFPASSCGVICHPLASTLDVCSQNLCLAACLLLCVCPLSLTDPLAASGFFAASRLSIRSALLKGGVQHVVPILPPPPVTHALTFKHAKTKISNDVSSTLFHSGT